MTKYCKDILKDKPRACKKHKQACQRFLDDLKKSKTKDFPYKFDEKKANRFLAWMRLFKHTKGVLARQYIEPAPIQKFIFGNIYGWVDKKTGYRRFKKAYWQVGRRTQNHNL